MPGRSQHGRTTKPVTLSPDESTDLSVSYRDLLTAVHDLHEQAHGAVPFRTCTHSPCRDLARRFETVDLDGPAPLVRDRIDSG